MTNRTDTEQDNRTILRKLVVVAVLMFGFGWALVPLYRKICEVTGINVVTTRDADAQRTARNTQVDTSRKVIVEFDANSQGPWRFRPHVNHVEVHPGELVHVDCKKLGRIVKPGHRVTADRRHRAKGVAGWQYLFVAIDDHSRLGVASIYPDETAASALAFLEELVCFYGAHGITVERVLTDNGTCFKRRWADACAGHAIAVRKTRAYRPQTNGKAERFIRTLLERWAYAYPYAHEAERVAALPTALDFYNRFRPHRALGGLAPLQRVNNLPGTYS